MATEGKPGIRVTASDALEFEPVQPEPPKRRWGMPLFLTLVVIGGGAGAWKFYGHELRAFVGEADTAVPLIKAPPGPVKVRPDNPGGLRVPDRDKLVYDKMGGDGGGQAPARGPERLLPPPEQPLPPPGEKAAAIAPPSDPKLAKKAPTAAVKPVAKVPTVKDVKAAIPPPPPPPAPSNSGDSKSPVLAAAKKATEKKTAAVAAPPVQKTAPEPKAPPKPAPKPAPVKAPPAQPPTPKPRPTDQAFLVQLAAARSPEGAQSEWRRLKRQHGDLLGKLGLKVTKADLGAKGIFYRLRAGPIGDEATARALCQQLAQRQVGCLIIKPVR